MICEAHEILELIAYAQKLPLLTQMDKMSKLWSDSSSTMQAAKALASLRISALGLA